MHHALYDSSKKKHKASFWTLSKEGTFFLCPVNQDSYIRAKILSKKTTKKANMRQTQGPIMSSEHKRHKRLTQMSPPKSISALLYIGMFPDTIGIKHPTDHWSSCVTLCLFPKFSLGDFLHRLHSLFSMIMWTVQDVTFLISLYFLYNLNQCTTFIPGNLEQSSTTTYTKNHDQHPTTTKEFTTTCTLFSRDMVANTKPPPPPPPPKGSQQVTCTFYKRHCGQSKKHPHNPHPK